MQKLNYQEFDFLGHHYRAWPDGVIDRYDGPKLGWNTTFSLGVLEEAKRLGLVS